MEPLLILILAAIFVASFVQRIAGFGYGLIIAPLGLLYFAPLELAPFMPLWGLTNSIPTLLMSFKHVSTLHFRRIVPWMALGVLLGFAALVVLPVVLFKWMAIILCMQAIVSIFNPVLATRGLGWISNNIAAGTMAGVLNATLGSPGPPLIVYFSKQTLTQAQFVAIFAAIFVTMNILRALSFTAVGVLPGFSALAEQIFVQDFVRILLIGTVLSLAGVGLGQLVVHRVSGALFKRIAAFLIALSALGLLIDILRTI